MRDTGRITNLTEDFSRISHFVLITADTLRQGKIREDQHAGKLYPYDIII